MMENWEKVDFAGLMWIIITRNVFTVKQVMHVLSSMLPDQLIFFFFPSDKYVAYLFWVLTDFEYSQRLLEL